MTTGKPRLQRSCDDESNADMGYYVLPVEAFAPDSITGAPARLYIAIQDLKNPGTLSGVEYENESSARLWNDFGPYFALGQPDRPWRRADPTLRSPKADLECDAGTGKCTLRVTTP